MMERELGTLLKSEFPATEKSMKPMIDMQEMGPTMAEKSWKIWH